jgi:hypothetical protein
MIAALDVLIDTVDNCSSPEFLVPLGIDSQRKLDRTSAIIDVLPEGDDMPPKLDKIAEINKRIDELRDEVHAISKPEPRYVRLYRLVLNHKGTSIWLSIVLCCVGIYGKYWLDHRNDPFNSAVDGRIVLALKAPGGVMETLSEVQKTANETNITLKALQPFINDVINHQFENVSKLSSQAFGERLPAIKNLLTAASEQNVKIEPAITKNLTQKLLQVDVKSNGYWPTAAEFLKYRSQAVTPDLQSLLHSDLPNCTDHDPQHNMVVGATSPHTVQVLPAQYMNCKVVLDSQKDLDKINAILRSQLFLAFDDCVIVYRGGAVEIASSSNSPETTFVLIDPSGKKTDAGPAKFEGPGLRFNNCLFLFSIHDTPPPTGQYLTRTLLAQDAALSIYQQPKG